jgi:hypothetical protein
VSAVAAGDVPIACTLSADDLPARLAEWQDFHRSSVRAIERTPSSARLLLAPSDEVLVAAASLSQLEVKCCAFFEFAIVLHAEERWLHVTVPAGAEDTLSSFLDILGSGVTR